MPRVPRLTRILFVLGGSLLIAASVWIAIEKRKGRSPAFYRWSEISSELEVLGKERRFAQAEKTALEATRMFPLRSEAYYWLAGYLRMFEGTEKEIESALLAGRTVEPVLPGVVAEQALILQPIDANSSMQLWLLAVQRAAAIDAREDRVDLPTAGNYIGQAIRAFQGDKERQVWLAHRLTDHPVLLSHWISQAEVDAAGEFVGAIANEDEFLGALPPAERRQVLSRLISLPDADQAVAYMEKNEALSTTGEYWPVLARYYAAQKDLPRAVRRVASSCGVVLEVPRVGDDGLRGEMAAVIAQGNTVAARRMASEAIASQEAQADHLKAAMAYFASQNDWESAWKAASRLALDPKLGH